MMVLVFCNAKIGAFGGNLTKCHNFLELFNNSAILVNGY